MHAMIKRWLAAHVFVTFPSSDFAIVLYNGALSLASPMHHLMFQTKLQCSGLRALGRHGSQAREVGEGQVGDPREARAG